MNRNDEDEKMVILLIWAFLITWCIALHYFAYIGVRSMITKNESIVVTEMSSPEFYTERFKVTAYCPCSKCCGRFADGITASGYKIELGDKFVAAPKAFPFGTVMFIDGYGNVEVKDRGGAIKDGRLDVYFDTHQEALNWGIKYLNVKVYN